MVDLRLSHPEIQRFAIQTPPAQCILLFLRFLTTETPTSPRRPRRFSEIPASNQCPLAVSLNCLSLLTPGVGDQRYLYTA